MTEQIREKSAGVVLLDAAWRGLPRTSTDRERLSAMRAALDLAIRHRFAFHSDDAAALRRYCIQSGSGIFRPLDEGHYTKACHFGGTFPRLWETACHMKPWIAANALASRNLSGYGDAPVEELLGRNRVATGMGALLPATFLPAVDAPELARFQDQQVWWITSMAADQLTLCRYRVADEDLDGNNKYRRVAFGTPGKPARVRKLTRKEWDALNAVEELKAA